MKVNVVRRKLIKPYTPTPQNLKEYKISFTDELSPPINVGIFLFYPSKPKQIIRRRLEESLAKILARFYPLAGRYINKDHLVDCSDQGAEYVEAEAPDVELMDHLMAERQLDKLDGLLPHQLVDQLVDEASDPPLLSVQITEFKLGGLVIGISVSHRIFDASSLATFVAAWSSASNPGPGAEIAINPSFESPSLFPGKNRNYGPDPEPSRARNPEIVIKRFLFNTEAITSLRSKLMPKGGKRAISRVRVVSAFIAVALIGVDGAKHGQPRACIIAQPVNMRERTIPPLPKHSCGNSALQSISRCIPATETEDMGIQELVHIIGATIDKTIRDCHEILSAGEDGQNNSIINPVAKLIEEAESGQVNVLWFSDWSKFGFYEADFGWGKPAWAGIGAMPGENLCVLMDNKDGDGIEAWLHLKQNDMTCFEQDERIKLFTN